ncbi:hypothetical protein F3N42_03810 [Marinihelvus fidelis]|uniref:Uncharacterized protein n=1 Tax=Marinihelvus fidelis TaxID=2613842 RepID=A0A5N0TH73_9GAMM|nr:hypothetical protein [Marinihelvus fidelis]KAA9133487.1 hypothetical protein F3N42_03810 [Marinihelvus fidelis]
MKKPKHYAAELLGLAKRAEWPDNCPDALRAIQAAGSGDSKRAEALSTLIHGGFYPEAFFSMRCAVAIGNGDLVKARLLLNDLQLRLGTDKRVAA